MQEQPPPPRMPALSGRVVAKNMVRLTVVSGGQPFTRVDYVRWGRTIRRSVAARNDPTPPSLPPGGQEGGVNALPGALTRQERQVWRARTALVARSIRSNAPTGDTCDWCRGSFCDYCHWTGLRLVPETEVPNG